MKHRNAILLFNIFCCGYGTNFAGNVWDHKGISPALTTMGGGYKEPMIRKVYETE